MQAHYQLHDDGSAASPNQITVSVPSPAAGSTVSAIAVQSYQLGYPQTLLAANDQTTLPANQPVAATLPTPHFLTGILNGGVSDPITNIIANPPAGVSASDGYTVSGFSQAPVSLWRVTSGVPTLLTGCQPLPSVLDTSGTSTGASTGAYSLSFADLGDAASEYFATAQPLQPDRVTPLDHTGITSGSSTSAQYLIITPPDFIPTRTSTQLPAPGGTSTLLAYKSSQMSTKVVDVNSIYDQYSNGQVNPEAIRTYLTYAHASLGATFVLLVGGDTFDYQNYYNCPTATSSNGHPVCGSNLNNRSFIPSLYTNSMQELDTPSDNLLAVPASAASDAPQVAIGRMPVYTTAELRTVLTKSMNWSSGPRFA